MLSQGLQYLPDLISFSSFSPFPQSRLTTAGYDRRIESSAVSWLLLSEACSKVQTSLPISLCPLLTADLLSLLSTHYFLLSSDTISPD